jgi:hypothetical protein
MRRDDPRIERCPVTKDLGVLATVQPDVLSWPCPFDSYMTRPS